MRKHYAVLIVSAIVLAFGIFFVNNDTSTEAKSDNHAVITSVNLDCKQCMSKAEAALGKMIGIKDYKLNEDEQAISVTFNPHSMQPEWIVQALEAAGFNPGDIQ
ncbi:heavy-metal-associated domain-containing protein [Tuberibacillus sp. Marseille-P3662]|uniref:heavy-metal-associated domain-containing protein n=1 Tax=Tuberibacillus sp. Marseille-P3662 TaxID=1965358 RepID=UPI001592F252|nr:heavy metal-associated domain-containing protein [Tuberibacillus sp. Marseille-P3662]